MNKRASSTDSFIRPSIDRPRRQDSLPNRNELLHPLLERANRTFVPIRRDFIQKPRETMSNRGSRLAELTRKSPTPNAHLLIHALASSSTLYIAKYSAVTWVQLARLDESASFQSGKSHWSKIVKTLQLLSLIRSEWRGNLVQYQLLHESGNGADYSRPKTCMDGNCFSKDAINNAQNSTPNRLQSKIARKS